MNKSKFRLTLCVTLAVFWMPVFVFEAYGGGTITKNYYYFAQLTAQSSGNGKVYASSTSASLENATETSSTAGPKQDAQNYGASAPENGAVEFFVYAKANDGYKFDGWSENSTRPSTFLSEDASYAYSVAVPKQTSSSNSAPSNATLINAKETETSTTSTSNSTAYYSRTTNKTLYAYFSEKVNATITFEPAVGGTYTYNCTDGSGIIANESQSITTKEEITLTAMPDADNKFYGWYTLNGTTEEFFSYSATFTKAFGANTTIYAKFLPSNAAIYTIKGTDLYFYDLNVAISAAQNSSSKVIIPTINGTVLAGNYTIPSGVTLLVPFDAAYTVYTSMGESNQVNASPTGQAAFKKMTLAEGVTLTINGTLNVGAKQNAQNPYGGCVYGKFGQIHMQEGSNIVLNSGSNLYAWGYITGDGIVTAKSGSVVHEFFQLTDFRGGNCTSSVYSNRSTYKVFPFIQFYIQNIEAKLVLEYGSTEKVYSGISTGAGITATGAITLVGSSSGLFRLQSGAKLTKCYDAEEDRQIYVVDGNASIENISLNVYVDINSTEFVLPLTNNMYITINPGATFTMNNAIALQPGVRVVVKEGGIMNISSSGKLYVYDREEWKGTTTKDGETIECGFVGSSNLYVSPLPYSPSKSNIKTYRTYANMKDATIDIQGQLQCNGALYTTSSGANVVCTQGQGKIVLNTAAPSANKTYQVIQSGNTVGTWAQINVTSSQLHNDSIWYKDGLTCEYLATAGCGASTTITYANGHWGWMEVWKDYDGRIIKAINTIAQSSSGTAPENPTRDCYVFNNWATETDATNQEVVHTATYTSTCGLPTYTITWKNYDGTVLETDTDVEENATPTYDGATPTRPSTAQYTYTFNNTWSPTVVPATEDAVYTAQYDSTVNTFTVRFLVDGEVYDTQTVEYGSDATLPTEPTKTGYTFIGWDKSLNNITADTDINAQFSINSYEITFKNADGTTLNGEGYSGSYEYNSTLNPANPTMENTAKYTFTFREWQPALQPVTAIATYTAVYDSVMNTYLIQFVNENDSLLQSSEWEYGATPEYNGAIPTKDSTAQYTYTFSGWAPEVVSVTAAATYKATFSSTVNTYTIIWKNENGAELEKDENVPYGETPEYNGATPTKDEDAQYTYTFNGWTPDVVTVTGDAEYTAVFTATKKTVSGLTFTSDDETKGTVTVDPQQSTYEYGQTVTVTATPNEGYEFAGWSDGSTEGAEREVVIDETTESFYAIFTPKKYLITFVNWDGIEVLQSSEWEYGATPVYTGETPTKEEDSENWYAFDGWTPEIVEVQNEATYTASFREIPKNGATGMSDVDANGEIVVIGHTIMISGVQEGKEVYVYDAQGNMIAQAQTSIETVTINIPSAGMYIVRLMDGVKKIVISQ